MRRPIAFITGIAGFAGSWLAEELLLRDYVVVGTLYEDEPTINLIGCLGDIELVPLDLLEAERTEQVIQKVKPDYVYHLAAMSSVGQSFGAERFTYRVNFEATLNVLQAVRAVGRLKKMVFTSSCDPYGSFTPKNKTLTEEQEFNPVSPYGISKAAAELVCRYYHRQYGVPVTVARAFNHTGPRQAETFVVPAFARQVAAIDLGRQKPVLKVGDLSARRDFSDVRDIVKGYRLLAEKGKPGRAYHLCSGRAVSIEHVLNMLTGLAGRKVRVTVDRSRLRKNDIPVLRGSNRRAVNELGWVNRYSLKQTLQDTFHYWKQTLSSET